MSFATVAAGQTSKGNIFVKEALVYTKARPG